MIELITGAPRSGKTYLTVKLILEQFFDFNKEIDRWEKKPDKQDITLITNIEGLRLDHIPLVEALKSSSLPIHKFFTKDYQEKISKKYPNIVYAIDECQQYFPDTFRDIDTRFYFEWHGHLGHHIYLITQDRFRCCRAIVSLAELETRAVKRTLSIAGEFKYNVISDGIIIDRRMFKPSKKIYRLYRSQFRQEHKKPGKPFLKYIIVPIILVFVFGYLLISRFTDKTAHADIEPQVITKPYLKEPSKVDTIKFKEPSTWVNINGTVYRDDKLYRLVDPITNNIIPPEYYPYKIRKIGSQHQANIPNSILNRSPAPNQIPDPVQTSSDVWQPDHQGRDRSRSSP